MLQKRASRAPWLVGLRMRRTAKVMIQTPRMTASVPHPPPSVPAAEVRWEVPRQWITDSQTTTIRRRM